MNGTVAPPSSNSSALRTARSGKDSSPATMAARSGGGAVELTSLRVHVLAGSVRQRRMFRAAHRRRRAAFSGPGRDPARPLLPPRLAAAGGAGEPLVGIVGQPVVDPMHRALARGIDDAGDVPRVAEHELRLSAEQP